MLILLTLSFPIILLFALLLLLLTDTFLHPSKLSTKRFQCTSPPSYPLIGSLICFYQNRHRLLDWYTELLSCAPTRTIVVKRFGARRTIVTTNPSNVEYILKSRFSNFPKGKPFTELLGDLLGCGIFNVDGELWSSQRKLASHEFSTKSLREFVVKVLDEEVNQRLVPLLESAAENDVLLDLQEVLKRFTFDAICRVSLGIDPCCLDMSRPVPPLVRAFDLAAEISAKRGNAALGFVWKVKRFFNVGSEKKLKGAVELIRRSVLDIVTEKKRHLGDKSNDLLSKLLSSSSDNANNEEQVVRDMVISFIMAGRDTTSAAMTWLFWLLSVHSDAEEEVLKEVSSLLMSGDGGETTSSWWSLHFDALKEMKFVRACLCESMRLYPPVAWDSKHPIKDDVLPDGTPVYAGDRVTYFPYGMGRMKDLWGADCLNFNPYRWFDESGGGLKSVSPYEFPVFQAGPRVCLGKEMAFIQMKYVVASLVQRFKFRPVSSDRPVFVPLLTAHMAGGFKVKVEKRIVGNP